MDDEVVTITLSDENGLVSPERLIAALESTISALKGIEPHLALKQEAIQWKIVRASMNSPMSISLKPIGRKREVKKANRVARAFYEGMRTISLAPLRPKHFDDEVLEAAAKLGASDDTERVTIQVTGQDPITPPAAIRENVKAVITTTAVNYSDTGTIEGRLDNILTHDGFGLQIWESFTNLKIDCIVTEPQIEEAKRLLRRRVSVSGLIKYRNDKPFSIKVDSFTPMREQHELPQSRDFKGLNITGGLLPEEYIRMGRDE